MGDDDTSGRVACVGWREKKNNTHATYGSTVIFRAVVLGLLCGRVSVTEGDSIEIPSGG